MRSDINILWIEDSPEWQKQAEQLFNFRINDYGLLTNINYVSEDIVSLFAQIKNEAAGYKIYDIIFIDYNISGEDEKDDDISQNITGDKIIEEFRKYDIDADILFYSENLSEDRRQEIILSSSAAFDGIYLASRKDFQDKALKLYRKNIRKLTSMLNIRGLLTDKTSENDYVIKSYLLEKYDKLSDENKKIVSEKIKLILGNNLNTINTKSEEVKKLCDGNVSIKKVIKFMDVFFSILDKYHIFEFILGLNNNMTFAEHSIDDYAEKIIKMRNKVAHKKIDICKRQNYLKYYDILEQYRERTCPDNCSSDECPTEVSNNNISLDDWKETLKLANEYSKLFDKILKELETETDSPEQ